MQLFPADHLIQQFICFINYKNLLFYDIIIIFHKIIKINQIFPMIILNQADNINLTIEYFEHLFRNYYSQ